MNDFKLSKRVRILSKILGQKSALEIFGAQKLGAGVTGDVFSTKGAAVKVAKGKKDRKVLEHEANILKALGRNKSTPNLLGKGKNYLAMQKLEGGPLSKHLSRIKSDSVFAEYICRRTIEAIGSLHRKGVAQRDLHSNNIFITDDYKVKVIDFGQASSKYGNVYRETFFGTNTDPNMGALSLIGDIFQGTRSYKTYQNVLKKHIEKICERKGADVKLLFTDYSSVEGDDDKEARYFDNFELVLYPISTDSSEVRDFYNDIDKSLRINTRNPESTKKVKPKTSMISRSTVSRSINRKPSSSPGILKFEQGGIVPEGRQIVELHGKELVIPEGETQIYKPADKFVDDGKEFADKIVTDLDDALEDTSNQIMDDIDAIIAADKKKYEDFKKQLNRKVDHPKLYPELQHIKTRYMWGQYGLYDLEFKSDIDRAIYFLGKLNIDKEDTPDKVAVRAWLLEVTGLSFHEDYKQIKEYRKRILDLVLQLLKLHPEERDVIVPPVYDGYYQDPDDEEDEENEQDYDDLEENFDGLDDLLNDIKSEEKNISEEKVVDNVEEEIVDAAEEDEEDPMADVDIDINAILNDKQEALEDIAEKLQEKINKPKKESSYTSNKKIFEAIITNFGRIQSTLDTVNRNLEKQNELIKASIETQLAIGELISSQTVTISDKFDMILKQFEMQNAVAQQRQEELERAADESSLEAQRDAAGTVDYSDLTKKSGGKKRENKIEKYLKSRLTKKLYRKLPKSVRNARQKVRKLQRFPGRVKGRIANKFTSILPSKGRQAVGALSKIKGLGSMGRMAGPARYVFAGLEYNERKASGQSEVQALSGVGGGLAGAAAGGVAGAKAGAAAGAAIGALFGGIGAGPGAVIGSVLGGLIGSIGGGMAGGAVADKVTGAHESGTGYTKPGTAILHGTEAVIRKDAPVDMSPMSTLGGIMIASATQYINSAGAIASPIAPSIKSVGAQMAKEFDVPSTIAQTNVGGSLPSLEKELKKVKEKRKQTPEEELSAIEKDLLETQDSQSFADKLLKILDPEGKFQQLLQQINNRQPVGETGEGMATFGESGIDKGTGWNSKGWVHGHFQNSNKQALINDTFDVVKQLINSEVSTVITATNRNLTKDMSDDQIRKAIEAGIDGHKKYGSGVYAIDVSVPTGTKVPFELENVYDSNGPGGIVGTMKGRTTQIMHLAPGSKAGAAPSTTPTIPTAQGLGKQGAVDNKNFGATSGVGSKGYLIVPGHAAGGGAPEEKKLVKQLARNAYNNVKSKFPDANVHYQDTDGMFDDTDEGFKKQLEWFKQKEKEGWEILEIHMDASIESGQGTGRGVIAPTGELNPVEAYFAQNYGAFTRGHRDLGAPKRGVGLFELGNMSPELQQAAKENKVSKQQLDALTAPLERALQVGLNVSPPSTQRSRFESLQGKDNDYDTKYLIVNQSQQPTTPLPGGGAFVEMSPGRWRTSDELSTTMRNLYIQKLGQ